MLVAVVGGAASAALGVALQFGVPAALIVVGAALLAGGLLVNI